MTHEEVVKKLDFLIRSYQNLIDNQVSEGEIVGPGVKGTWKADAPIIKSYQNNSSSGYSSSRASLTA